MTPRVTIRPAKRGDRSALLFFHRALYLDHRRAISEPEMLVFTEYRDMDTALQDDVDALLSNPASVVLIAHADGVPVGYITGHVETDERRALPRRGVVEDWFVDPELRRHGTGRQLLEKLVEEFRVRGCQVVESMTWTANAVGRAAHDSLGFRELQVRYRMRIDAGAGTSPSGRTQG